jgi:phage terminase large subunit GpA-like protein
MTSFFAGLTNERSYPLPSEYIEQHRYLPKELTRKAGYYRYDYTPYLRKMIDYFHPTNPIHKIVFLKPAQIGATTGILEAAIAYNIGAVPTPQLYISADKELVELGMETKVERMLDSCGLRDLIGSQTGSNSQNKGDKKTEKEYPGGFLHAIGAQSPGKLRQMSYPVILFDELDGFPDRLANEGDPVSLAENRSKTYEDTRKLLYLSTPLVMQTSKIYKLYLLGDQQMFYVPCKNCKNEFVMHWHAVNSHGDKYGITWDYKKLPTGDLILDKKSVGYVCPHCGYKLRNFDKAWMLPRGEWKATATAHESDLASHWLNACYSPPGMYSWTGMVKSFLKCWDPVREKIKDIDAYRTFRNTDEGLPFEERGEQVSYDRVITHRRSIYALGQIPNKAALQETGSPILQVTCAVDVQKSPAGLYVDVKGWCTGGRSYTLYFDFWEGVAQDFQDPVWRRLEDFIENKVYIADDGAEHRIDHTLIDAAWGESTDTVYQFCRQYSVGVYPIFGAEYLKNGLTYEMMSKATIEKAGCIGYRLNTTKLKDKIARVLNDNSWITGQPQPEWYPNFPDDLRDDFFKMLTAEYKAEKRDKRTGRFLGIEWRQIQGRDNHALDTFMIHMAGIEMLAEWACKNMLGMDRLSWPAYWEWLKGRF